MRVEFGKDGVTVNVVAETDADHVALSAWLGSPAKSRSSGTGTETNPVIVYGECVYTSIADARYGDPIGPRIVVFGRPQQEPDQTDLGASDDRPLGPDHPVYRK